LFQFSGLSTTAALANPYGSYSFQYGESAAEGQDGQQQSQTTGPMYEQTYMNHEYSTLQPSYYPLSMQSEYHLLHQQLQSTMITRPNNNIPRHTQERNSITTSISSQLSGSTRYEDSRRPSEYGHSEPSSRKRSRGDEFQADTQESPMYNNHLSLIIPGMLGSNAHQTSNQISPFQFRPPQLPQATSTDRSSDSDSHQLQLQQAYSPEKISNTNQHHHHHHLPPHSPILKRTKHGEDDSTMSEPGPPSMVGKEGMPEPAPRPKGPKLKFTREDDALLVRLKEAKNLTWKQIAEFFPGRSAGTLQVRYCTKLKAKTTLWNDDMVSRTFPCLLIPSLWRELLDHTRSCRQARGAILKSARDDYAHLIKGNTNWLSISAVPFSSTWIQHGSWHPHQDTREALPHKNANVNLDPTSSHSDTRLRQRPLAVHLE
jgi:hypothetical protein